MGLRKIVEQGDECLTKVCRPVTDFNARLRTLLDDMTETLQNAGGAGLAAPQVGVLRRVCIVMDMDTEEYIELVNPEIPGKWGLVERPAHVRVRAQDRNGEWFEVEGDGMTARCFCHELEHLDGHMYTEHIDRFLTDEEVEAYMEEEEE